MTPQLDPPAWIARLTPRQREILRLVRLSLNSSEIARALSVAPGTVDEQMKRVLRKSGVGSRREAARLLGAYEEGDPVANAWIHQTLAIASAGVDALDRLVSETSDDAAFRSPDRTPAPVCDQPSSPGRDRAPDTESSGGPTADDARPGGLRSERDRSLGLFWATLGRGGRDDLTPAILVRQVVLASLLALASGVLILGASIELERLLTTAHRLPLESGARRP